MCGKLFVVVWKFQILQAGCGFRLHNNTANITQSWTGHNLFGLAHVFPKAILNLKRRHCEIKLTLFSSLLTEKFNNSQFKYCQGLSKNLPSLKFKHLLIDSCFKKGRGNQ